jgi:hypothetical protein
MASTPLSHHSGKFDDLEAELEHNPFAPPLKTPTPVVASPPLPSSSPSSSAPPPSASPPFPAAANDTQPADGNSKVRSETNGQGSLTSVNLQKQVRSLPSHYVIYNL